LISIIIPTFERPNLLVNAVTSLLSQSYNNIEIIIVDDNLPSSQYREQTESKFGNHVDKRIKYIKHGQNKGANAARNTGFSYANGEYIAFLDDDDEYKQGKIEIQLETALQYKNENGVLVFVGAEIIRSEDKIYSNWIKNTSAVKVFESKEILYGNFIGSNSFVFVDRKSFEKVNGFDEGLPSCQDWDLWIRLSKLDVKLVGIPLPLVRYFERSDIRRITTDPLKKISGHLEIKEKHFEYISMQDRKTIIAVYKYLYYQILPFDSKISVELLKLQFTETKSLKDYILLFIDVNMLYLVKVPIIYRFLSRIKHIYM
jgi:glycosyltransferase involved in cell wall biosynthesis